MFLIPTTQAAHLTAKLLRSDLNSLTIIYPGFNRDGKRHFPDKELYVKIPEAKNLAAKRVVVLHSGAPKPNEGLVELELILQILRDSKASLVEVFFSYFPYGMQDSIFEKGETNVAENLIEKLLHYYGVKRIYVVDPHFRGRNWAKKYSLQHLSALPLLVEAAKKEHGKNLLLFSPDKGGKRRTGIAGAQKKRKNSYEVDMLSPQHLRKVIRGRTVAVVDDLVKTGGTLKRAAEECKKYGAKKILALVTHGVLSSGIVKAQRTYKKLYLTNTIKRKEANVDITPLLEDVLKGPASD